MDNSVFVLLVITGFCVPSTYLQNTFYFISEAMTWDDAFQYCVSRYTDLAQILSRDDVTTMMATPTKGNTVKAWIGLSNNFSEWTWLNGQPQTYYNWKGSQPNNLNGNEFCVAIGDDGLWGDHTCSLSKYPVCSVGQDYQIGTSKMSWNRSEAYCKSQHSTLAYVSNKAESNQVYKAMPSKSEGWIGLYKPEVWFWSEPGENFSFQNWGTSQPDISDVDSCVAAQVSDGTWSDEGCQEKLPFFCYEASKPKDVNEGDSDEASAGSTDAANEARKTMVKMKIKSSADLEDPAVSAELVQQLHTAFAEQGLEVKLTWRKHPVKTQEQQQGEDTCSPDESNTGRLPRHF